MSDNANLEILGRCIMNMPPALRAADPSHGIKGMRHALEDIAQQQLSTEMTDEVNSEADFEGAYDTMIRMARSAIAFGAR